MYYTLMQRPCKDETGQLIEIPLTENEVAIGRGTVPELEQYTYISRLHAIFYKSNTGHLFVKDCNSLNGVYVNGVKVGSGLHPLSIGDYISLGIKELFKDTISFCVVITKDDNHDYLQETLIKCVPRKRLRISLVDSDSEEIQRSHDVQNLLKKKKKKKKKKRCK